jgi:uncharacterized protein YdhG (YjbR/CyaY superfamily)
MDKEKIPGNIDEYIAGYPGDIRINLEKIRAAIREAAPEALEKISYSMPSYTLKGMLVYFAAHTNHLGFYPFKSAIEAFKSELEPYQTSKGTVQFPYNKPLPLNLIKKIIKFRVRENLAKAALKGKK